MQGQEEDSGLTSGLPFEVVDGRASDIILNLPRGTHGSGRVSGGREMHSVVIDVSGYSSWFRSVGSRGGRWSPSVVGRRMVSTVVILCLERSTCRRKRSAGKSDRCRTRWTPKSVHGTHADRSESTKGAIQSYRPRVAIRRGRLIIVPRGRSNCTVFGLWGGK